MFEPPLDEEVILGNDQARLRYRWASESMLNEEFGEQGIERALIVEDWFVALETRNGCGGPRLFKEFLRLADKHGHTVVLHAYPYEAILIANDWDLMIARRRRLVRFFIRFGFVEVCDGWMYRLGRRPGEVSRPYEPQAGGPPTARNGPDCRPNSTA